MVADGATAHRLAGGKIELIKLPAYAPELNPVERFFEEPRRELKLCIFESLDEAEMYLTGIYVASLVVELLICLILPKICFSFF
jgi:hypothetical protein